MSKMSTHAKIEEIGKKHKQFGLLEDLYMMVELFQMN